MRKLSLPGLKKKYWKMVSEFVRRVNADKNGMVSCISCGDVKHWKEMQAGHYIPKSLGLSVYFHMNNIHPQCVACNNYRHGNLTSYALGLIKKFGPDILDELESVRQKKMKFSRYDYEVKIAEIKEKLEALGGTNV